MAERAYDSKHGIIPLARALSKANVVSRKQASLDIRHGLVLVNGKVVREPAAPVNIHRDIIEHKGERVSFNYTPVYIAFNKPAGVITTTVTENNAPGARNIMEYFESLRYGRLFPCGRLDRESTGLIFITNDPDFLDSVTDPARKIEKEYVVIVNGRVTRKDIEPLIKGTLPVSPVKQFSKKTEQQVKKFAPCRIKIEAIIPARYLQKNAREPEGEELIDEITAILEKRNEEYRTKLRIILTEGQNREIRRMFSMLGFHVKSLKRVRIGPVRLLDLKPGEWRFISSADVNYFLKKNGKKKPATGRVRLEKTCKLPADNCEKKSRTGKIRR